MCPCSRRESSTNTQASITDARPKKQDIDKMHAYRDAIRDMDDLRATTFAAILYPGPSDTVRFGSGIDALSAVPGLSETLDRRLDEILAHALRATRAETHAA